LQLLGARQTGLAPALHGPGISWVGPVWFSAHALLFLAYALGGLARTVTRPVRRRWQPRVTEAEQGELVLGRRELLQRSSLFAAALPFGVSLSSVPLSYDFRV